MKICTSCSHSLPGGEERSGGCSVPIQVRCGVNTPSQQAGNCCLPCYWSCPPPPLSPPCKPDKSLWRHSRAPTHSATYTQPGVTVQTERLSTSCPKRSTVHMRVWRQSCQLSFFSSSSLSLPPFFPPSLPLLFHSPLGFFFYSLR